MTYWYLMLAAFGLLAGLTVALARAAGQEAPLPPMHSAYDDADTLPAIPLMRSEPTPLWSAQVWRGQPESEAWR